MSVITEELKNNQTFERLLGVAWATTPILSLNILFFPPEPLPFDLRDIISLFAVVYPIISFFCIKKLICYRNKTTNSPAYMNYDISGFYL